jgi:hypothetical protein
LGRFERLIAGQEVEQLELLRRQFLVDLAPRKAGSTQGNLDTG